MHFDLQTVRNEDYNKEILTKTASATSTTIVAVGTDPQQHVWHQYICYKRPRMPFVRDTGLRSSLTPSISKNYLIVDYSLPNNSSLSLEFNLMNHRQFCKGLEGC
jgi:hypothetical protein